MSRVLRLPGLGVECHVTEHALERYGERVRPHLEGDPDGLWADLRRMVQTCGSTLTLRPDWVREDWTSGATRDSDLWVHCGDIAFAVSKPSRRARASMTTVLIKGGLSEAARANRNRKRAGRTYRKGHSKRRMPRRIVDSPEPT